MNKVILIIATVLVCLGELESVYRGVKSYIHGELKGIVLLIDTFLITPLEITIIMFAIWGWR